ncbi:metabotropic glutamate receptor 2 isoform X1 [Drosophila eugracilis]|uniref:metabotropic glutamate receptor 2 isoform X1 n=1 Tax=Drosophila eugracilis TaxID=29029 RepID=UPI0007E8AC5E|nr:metabotropic glutamate receptor 2 isoform X1 [Drosophila eugracilis]
MQPLVLLALMLLLQQQQQPLLGANLSEEQLARLTDDGRSPAALSDNLNSTLVPGKTIKAIERQMKSADEVPPPIAATALAEKLQVTPANQLPVNTPPTSAGPTIHSTTRARFPDTFMAATMVTGNQSEQGELKRMKSAATLEAINATTLVPKAAEAAADVSVAAVAVAPPSAVAITAVIEATAATATSPTREQHMLLRGATAAQMARINVPAATIEDQIGRTVIPSKTNIARTEAAAAAEAATPTSTVTPMAGIMPGKTKRNWEDGANKSVHRDGIKFNPDAALSPGYVNATEAWPEMTTDNIVEVAVAVAVTGVGAIEGATATAATTATASTISPALTSTARTRISGKTMPTPRLLGSGAVNVAQILAKSLDSPPPTSSSGWPVKHAAVLEGDVILGGLMMVHSREDSITCGPIMPQGGIQALEAMLYTLDQVNKHQLLPNVTLGAHLLDDCDKDTYGLEMAVDFIKGSISNIDDAEYHCNKTQVRKVISGVVGAASSVTSIQVANLLRLFRIPQVSYFSTSPELSNKQRFEYFSRTIPSDHYQVKAMVEIVKRMGWSYVSIIYEESNYGIKAFEELEELLARHNICIAIKEKLVKDSGVAEDIAYDNIVQKLLTKPRARGAIIFGSDQEVRQVMRAVRRANATGSFSWIGSDGWSARNLVSDDYEPEVEGTLSVQPQANPVRGFEEYFLSLTVENNQRNPWFVEFWEDHFQCRYPGSTSTPYNNYTKQCTKKERLSRQNTDFEDQLQFVSDAVMAFAYALRDMHRDLCGGGPSLCEAMKPTKGADLLKYLRKVEFEGLSGDEFRFDGNGDGPARYNIIHFKQSQAGQYHWVKVGEYTEGELRLNMSEVKFKRLSPKPPESVCSLPCLVGQAKKYVEGESCCWHCFNCTTYQIRHPDDETHCKLCKLGTLPDAHKQYCRPIPEIYLRPESAWAIGAMAFSATGILVTLFVMGVFVRHNDTPIVRASGRELSYILLAGIFMCYGVTFALVLKPTNIVCAIQRFGVGFCFTVVYAALLTKTNRIARIFKAGKQSAKRPSFISPKSQLVICACLVSVQILINGVWMVIAPSHAMHHYPTREDNLLVCDSYIDASYMIAFSYPIVLIVICTVYAVLTRKIPEAFNESKHIGFTMYTTCVIWLAFVPLYFGTANHVPLRITSMSVTISLSASVTIACLFSPKLYIILIRPERNVRQSMMPPRYGNMHRTAGTGPSSMMAAAVVTAATCAQEEKIQKHITPTNTENSLKTKKLCEMATQTISSIITSLDINAYNQIPYADQYVPNNTTTATTTPTDKGSGNSNSNSNSNGDGDGDGDGDEATEQVVANNNKINQRQHGQPAVAFAITTANNHISGHPAATITTTVATGETTTEPLVAAITTTAPLVTVDVTEIASSVAANNGHGNGNGNGSQRPPVLQTNL